SVKVFNRSVHETRVQELARDVGLVIQDPEAQMLSLLVEDDVAFGPENLGLSPKAIYQSVEESLKLVGCEHLRNILTTRLSSGQKQRVAIASAFSMGVRMIVLDEPFSNVDPFTAAHIAKELADSAKKTGLTVVLVEHRLTTVAKYADRIIAMNRGKITGDGHPSSVLYKENLNAALRRPALVELFRRFPGLGTPLTVEEAQQCILQSTRKVPAKKRNALQNQNLADQVIEVKSVDFGYNAEILALKGISLAVRCGQLVSIMGANGAGKTTLLKLLAGLLKPTAGIVEVLGMKSQSLSDRQLSSRLSIVFQTPIHYFFNDSVENELRVTLKAVAPHLNTKARIEEVLCDFSLEELRHRNPYSLSMGQMKRLTIAMALSYDPDIVTLDEPTVGQDADFRDWLSARLRRLKARGKTVIVSTHDVEFATLTDRVVVLDKGQIVKDDEPRSVFYELPMEKFGLQSPEIVQLFSCIGDVDNWNRPLTPNEAMEVLSSVVLHSK
ncbi:MAG: ABC transporter ATP-binding protein, partial [Candidatus Bathyarchaeia archaeon]